MSVSLAILALLVGPLLAYLSARVKTLLPLIEGFVVCSVGALAIFALLPEAVAHAGAFALAAAALGLTTLTLLERIIHIKPKSAHNAILVLGAVGLCIHAVIDGFATQHGDLTAVGIALHRLPIGIALWWLLKPRFGALMAWGALAVVALATLGGAFLGHLVVVNESHLGFALSQAFIAGALLHVVFHGGGGSHHHDVQTFGLRLPETLGGVLGGALVVSLLPTEGLLRFCNRFLDLALESAPALVFGFVLAGLLTIFGNSRASWLRGKTNLGSALRGSAFGLPLPICSCGVVPIYQSMIQRGAPPAAAMAFLVATPELGIESLLLSLPLLGTELTITRLAAALFLALLVGTVVGGRINTRPLQDDCQSDEKRNLRDAMRFAFVDIVGDTAAWILAGIALAAAIEPGSLAFLAELPTGVDVALAAVAGVPLYICASGATPLAAALIFAGISPGAAIAFLLSGPATNVTTFGVLSKLHGRGAAFAFAGVVIAAAIALGIVANLYVSADAVHTIEESNHDYAFYHWLALAILTSAFGYTLLRQGPSNFFAPVLTFGERHVHDGSSEDACCDSAPSCCAVSCDDDHGHAH